MDFLRNKVITHTFKTNTPRVLIHKPITSLSSLENTIDEPDLAPIGDIILLKEGAAPMQRRTLTAKRISKAGPLK